MKIAFLSAMVGAVAGHGAMTLPPTRIGVTTKVGGQCRGTEPGKLPQYNLTCDWFNEGCAIGCKSCLALDCGHIKSSSFGKCCPEQMKPTLHDKSLRTYKDILGLDFMYEHTPWRAPGFAPVYDPCGVAGGIAEGVDPGSGGNAPPPGLKQGLSMQDLPVLPGVQTEWAAGSVQDVAWGMNANHGGGYSYRLCRRSDDGSKATEECFQKTHLKFVGDESWIQFGEDELNRTAIPAVRTSVGTNPAGSQWTKNPIAACGGADGGGIPTKILHRTPCKDPQFEPVLQDVIKPHPKFAPHPGLYGFGMGHCTSINNIQPNGTFTPGDFACTEEEHAFWFARFNFNVIDKVQIPADLLPGNYLLSFRWDSEQTPQIWTNCADVTITQQSESVVV